MSLISKRIGLAALAVSGLVPAALAAPMPPKPPSAPAIRHVSHDFGTPVVDDYRWMEKPGSKRLATFMREQNAYTRKVLDAIPGKQALYEQIKQDANVGAAVFWVTRTAGKIFYMGLEPGQDTAHLFVLDKIGAKPRLLIDPMRFSTNHIPQALNFYFVSPNGKYVAFGVSGGGSEQAKLRVLDVATGKLLPIGITRVDGDNTDFPPVSWLPDSKGFIYYRLHKFGAGAPVTDFYQKSRDYLHLLSANDPTGARDKPVFGYGVARSAPMTLAQDALVMTVPNSKYALGVFTENEELQSVDAIYAAKVADLERGAPAWRKVAGRAAAITGFALHGATLDIISAHHAPRYKVIRYDVTAPGAPKTVVAPGRDVITSLAAGKDGLYVGAMRDGMGRIMRVGYRSGKTTKVKMPFQGGLGQIIADPQAPGVWFHLAGWTTPPAWYDFSPATGKVANTGLQKPPKVSFAGIESKEVKAVSWDGTMIPVSIIMKKGTRLDGRNPTLLIGYGSYGITITPYFDPTSLAWLDRGGILAVAHVRGGGWYGQAWHKAGQKQWKINTVFDFIAAGQYLVDHHYTSPAHLAGEGGSAGGITIGGAVAWRPDLFAAAIDSHGDTNALRMQFSPNGPPNEIEFGNVLKRRDFHWIYAMDAMAHIRTGVKYPAILAITGANDPRVEPWEVAKFAARMQAASTSGRPVLLRVSYQSGHGIGSTKDQYVRSLADQDAFLFWQLGVAGFQPDFGAGTPPKRMVVQPSHNQGHSAKTGT
ncbi:prolyl oligopeptidase family serine peptidase [Acidiphilium iwatense]|uniref:prolyl oligopeptidase n=1 Tax=Acidiphilium iwatense TaxID=768198 RepID=A0ABS9DVC2_9PROT|nr:prolyl oligopeptidase family serine peptidase [Acidiphilium iwatense]MCF3945715.1 prolyl oligopeptidase family serine peptidase [Acidiphilium iwatense]